MKIAILLFSLSVITILLMINKINPVLYFISFLIPIAGVLFREYDNFISLSGLLIVYSFFATKIFPVKQDRSIKINLMPLYVISIGGLVIGLILENYHLDSLTYTDPIVQMFNFTSFLIIIIMFVKLYYSRLTNNNFQTNVIIIFASSSIYQILPFFFTQFGYSDLLPKFLVSGFIDRTTLWDNIFRYAGFLGDYELLVDYSVIVFGLSLIILDRGKKIGYITCIFSILLGLLSGTISFFFIIAIFLFIYVVLDMTFFKKFSVKLYWLILSILFIVILFYDNIIEIPIALRFLTFLSKLNHNEFIRATNRDYWNYYLVLENINILGAGPQFFISIKNSVLVSHNLYLAVYAKYGIWGLCLLAWFVCNIIVKLFKIIFRKYKNKYDAQVYISIVISLIFQQFKISFIRSLAPILVYSFFFLLISVYIKKANENI